MLATVSVGDLNSGVAVSEDATGTGFILYSQQVVHDRFGDIVADNADHFVAARLDGVQWQYNNDRQWVNFDSQDTDILVAEVNFDGDDVQHRFLGPMIEGIPMRATFEPIDADNDLYVVANQFGGQFDENEFQILGTQFQSLEVTAEEFAEGKISLIWTGALEYESESGSFPALANFDEAGQALLSWRVHILPQLGYHDLYEQFRLDEPWNSPHNLALSTQMPDVYQSNHFASTNRTSFLAAAGPDAFFPLEGAPQGFPQEIALALVEADAARSVVWTQPVDWYFNPADPLSGLGNASDAGFTAIDSRSFQYTLPADIDPVAFSNFVTTNDGNPPDSQLFSPLQNFPDRLLGLIGNGLLNYESSFQRFPSQSILADDGTPLLSWRVSILPFLGHNDLYEQFNLDEPWDSPNNIQLLDKMPIVFAHPDVEFGKTVYLGLDGDGTFFDSGRTSPLNFGTIPDGVANTIMLVEADADRAVEWSRPVDLSYDSANPFDGLGGLLGDGSFNAILANNEAINFGPTTGENLDAWATVAGNEINDYSFTDLVETQSVERKLRQLIFSAQNHESARREFPRTIYSTSNVNSPDGPGVPLLSWRVRILPSIGEFELYQQFNLDEPWDSPHNLSLLPLMPRIFATEGVEIKKTVFQGAHGDNTFFSNINRGRNFSSFNSNQNVAAILQVNSDQAIEWTKPGDFDFDPATLSTYLGNAQSSGFHFATIDGTVHYFNNAISDDVLRKILSPQDYADLDVDLKVFRESSGFSNFEHIRKQQNLRQLSLAALNFESSNQRFPQHAIYSERIGGEPLLSWRVAILPFLGHEDLYERFNLDEPWDSPHNLSLLPLMPYEFKTADVANGFTVFQAVTSNYDGTGDNLTVFPLTDRPFIGFGSIADGSSNTLLFVEAEADRAVEWTRPADLVFDPLNPSDGISNSGISHQGTQVVLADGSTHFIPGNVEDEFWAALSVINDGELFDISSPPLTNTGIIVPSGGTGTDGDDTFVITVSGDVVEISINGVSETQNVDDLGSVFINGLGGNDTLMLNTDGATISVVNSALQIGELFSIATSGIQTVDTGNAPVDFVGTEEAEQWSVDIVGQTASVSSAGSEFTLALDSTAKLNFDGGGGADQITFSTDSDTRVGYRSFQSGDQVTNWQAIERIEVQGQPQDGTSIRFLDSVRDDVFRFFGTGARMTTDGQPEINAGGFDSILIGATEGNDVARLSGNEETDDRFIGTSSISRFITPDITVVTNGFDLVAATSNGGNDLASLVGTAALEKFFAGPELARMDGDGFALNATGFAQVIGISGGGDDTANVTDTAGADQLYVRPNFGHSALSTGATITMLNFPSVRAVSTSGADFAQLLGSAGDNRLVSQGSSFSRLTGEDFSSIAIGFSTIRSNGLTGNDTAFLTGSQGNDYFFASPTNSFINGQGFQNAAQNFETVLAIGTEGTDAALFADSTGDDRFYANSAIASLTGDGFARLALGFNSVRATSSGGNDSAVLRDSQFDDVFYATPTTASMRGPFYQNVAEGYSAVRGVSTVGIDRATLMDSTGNDHLLAFQSSSTLSGVGYSNSAVGFGSVTAVASTGNDTVEMYDSQTDDRFFARQDSGSLSGAGYNIIALGFDTFDLYGFNGGINQIFVADPDFELNRFGDWRS